jgi:tetratricopeptide (TPR) repeat protein
MNAEQLVEAGNQCRSKNNPEQALLYYAQAFTQDPDNFSAWNNYGNVLRECGRPDRAIAFLQNALVIAPEQPTANFNLAVCYLLLGDYQRGWPQYEHRWRYEHLAGLLPKFKQPQWAGEDLKDKTILVLGEQGHGDTIQFSRFINNLSNLGAHVKLQTNDNVAPLFTNPGLDVFTPTQDMGEFDYWIPIMSIPRILDITLETLPQDLQYLEATPEKIKEWHKRLGLKNKLRIGFAWSGRRDSWINQHKAMPFLEMLTLIKSCPDYEWYNLQADCTTEEEQILLAAGVKIFTGSVKNFADTAGLVHHLDVVLSVDTAIAHLAGAMGRPTWVMLNNYALDWRWLLNRDDSPWYSSARLFRQPVMGDWTSVTKKIYQYLSWFKI